MFIILTMIVMDMARNDMGKHRVKLVVLKNHAIVIPSNSNPFRYFLAFFVRLFFKKQCMARIVIQSEVRMRHVMHDGREELSRR